jgi:hypothetical protein
MVGWVRQRTSIERPEGSGLDPDHNAAALLAGGRVRSGPVRLVAIGGSDAGISAALRARELDPTAEVTVVLADAYPNFSICGIPYYVSGEVCD